HKGVMVPPSSSSLRATRRSFYAHRGRANQGVQRSIPSVGPPVGTKPAFPRETKASNEGLGGAGGGSPLRGSSTNRATVCARVPGCDAAHAEPSPLWMRLDAPRDPRWTSGVNFSLTDDYSVTARSDRSRGPRTPRARFVVIPIDNRPGIGEATACWAWV